MIAGMSKVSVIDNASIGIIGHQIPGSRTEAVASPRVVVNSDSFFDRIGADNS
jgi:hypothetical protein